MPRLHVYKYQGAGNDFVVIDNRRGEAAFLTPSLINRLCDRRFGVGADGLMTLCSSDRAGFGMRYYNADGPEGTMCGNGGRCLVAFADFLGIRTFDFEACDGLHRAEVTERHGAGCTVRLQMCDAAPPVRYADGWLLETGSTHFVQWVSGLETFDVDGRRLRRDARFPKGANVNFVEPQADGLFVRTYERGVEAETWACGTGATASALASYLRGEKCYAVLAENGAERIKFAVRMRGGGLAVDFIPLPDGSFRDVWLTGPAVRVFETDIDPEVL